MTSANTLWYVESSRHARAGTTQLMHNQLNGPFFSRGAASDHRNEFQAQVGSGVG